MFRLAWPWVLCLLPLPWLIKKLFWVTKVQINAAVKVPFYSDMAEFNQARSSNGSGWFMYFVIVWGLLLLAVANPEWVDSLPQTSKGRNLMLVLDISGSMNLNDMVVNGQAVTRLAVIKHTARQFINQRKGDKIGLILFGSQAYLQTPLTYDHQNVLMRLAEASVGLAGNTTSIGDALGLAIKKLQRLPKASRTVILLTDGVNNSGIITPLKAADLAKEAAIKVYTIGLGSQVNAFNTGAFLNANADLDEDTLIKIATLTKGKYFKATDLDTLASVYQTIDQLETVKQPPVIVHIQKNYYVWPLAFAWLLIMFYLLYPWLAAIIFQLKQKFIKA